MTIIQHSKVIFKLYDFSGAKFQDSQHIGFLNKRGERGFQFYKKRYFVLREDDLYYCYDNSMPSMLNPLGKIDVKQIDSIELQLDVPSLFGPTQHHLFLHTPKRIYLLNTDNKKDAIKWSNWYCIFNIVCFEYVKDVGR
jgi:hypothetical protein